MKRVSVLPAALFGVVAGLALSASDPTGGDWPMWGGTPDRNMVSTMRDLPLTWDVEMKQNVKWTAKLGSQTYGNPVVARGAGLHRYQQRPGAQSQVVIGEGDGWVRGHEATNDLGRQGLHRQWSGS